ncbi:MAG: TraB/GumN family protein [Gammaproteobacteria bacterium]|nr:TraB/GumN family protein [Gammaproteobacteria bacterium]
MWQQSRQRFQNFMALLALFLLAQVAIAEQTDRGLIWKAEKDGQSIFLLGAIHMANASFYPLRAYIENTYKNSDALVVEADILAIEKDSTLQQQVLAESLLPPDESLRDHISVDTYKKLSAWLRARKLPEKTLFRQRPAILITTLSVIALQAQGLESEFGIDRHFLNSAYKSAKPVLELESVIGQLRLLNSLENPEFYLQQTLDQLNEIKTFVPKLISTWKTGDASGIHKLLFADELEKNPQYKLLYEKLFFNRNLQMAEKLLRFSKLNPKLFVVIGAGHLVGERSVIAYLRKQGFSVEQM